MKFTYLFSLILAFLLSGCVTTKCTLATVEKSLTKEEKKQLYNNIQSEIDHIVDDADTYYAKSYYLQALQSYELINFYNGHHRIPARKIERLQKRIEANKKHYYTKATSEKYAKDKMKQMFYLNELMRNDPEYKNGKELYLALRQDEDVTKVLQHEKQTLETLLQKDANTQEYILKLYNAITNIARYDDMEPLVIQGCQLLKDKRYLLRDEALQLYKNNKLKQAKEKFEFIKTIYKKDKIANRYLKMIINNSKLSSMENQALVALKKSDYKGAIEIANEILSFNNNNSKALNIFKKANKELKKQIPKMIQQATKYYSKQEYDKALKVFQDILKLDSRNNTALTYTKKIKAQLRTIRNLKGK